MGTSMRAQAAELRRWRAHDAVMHCSEGRAALQGGATGHAGMETRHSEVAQLACMEADFSAARQPCKAEPL